MFHINPEEYVPHRRQNTHNYKSHNNNNLNDGRIYSNLNIIQNNNSENNAIIFLCKLFKYIKRKRRDPTILPATSQYKNNVSKSSLTNNNVESHETVTNAVTNMTTSATTTISSSSASSLQSISCCLLCRCESKNQYCSCYDDRITSRTLKTIPAEAEDKTSPTINSKTCYVFNQPSKTKSNINDLINNNYSYNFNKNNNKNNISENNYSEIRRIHNLIDYLNNLKRIMLLLLVLIQIILMNNFTKFKRKIMKTASFRLRHLSMFMLFIYMIMNSAILNVPIVHATQVSPATHETGVRESGICQSMDIRNSPLEMNRLANCRVVEGFVQILLIDKYSDSDYDNLTFPLLIEITDYLLLYRVNGLITLQKLFPNLSVIRGNVLFSDYALVIYEMTHIQEIGLTSLQYIGHGAIRVEKNPKLCHVDDIDWSLITKDTLQKDHFIADNGKENTCPICPGSNLGKHSQSNSDGKNKTNSVKCPLSKSDPVHKRSLCWNVNHCQKICPANCSACINATQCCPDNCLGGCSNTGTEKCIVCRKYSLGDGDTRHCVNQCPDGMFVHMERRCITETECREILRPLDVKGNNVPEKPYMPFNGKCTMECPADHSEVGVGVNRTCERCDGSCKKVCTGANIDSIESIKQMRGCTHITGALEIHIRSQGGLNIVRELEQSMSLIEEIDGYLKVVRSYPLLSLNFLKRLKRVTGSILESKKYSIYIMDNQNLQSLWDSSQNITVEKGELFFHFNPKLCFNKIEDLEKMAARGVKIATPETARLANGDRASCNVIQLNVSITKIESFSAILEWEPLKLDDERSLLGYLVYSIYAPFQNVTLFDGRDACGADGWHVDDVTEMEYEKPIQFLLNNLSPYTQYAFYVKTLTIASEKNGAQSDIQYIRTNPSQPEKVQKIRFQFTNSSNGVTIEWDQPRKINGNLTSYIIKAELMPENQEILSQRNYCVEPVNVNVLRKDPDPEIKLVVKPPTNVNGQCDCDDCPLTKADKRVADEDEVIERNSFEDQLQNWVYIKRTNTLPEVRSKRSALLSLSHTQDDYIFPLNDNKTYNNDAKEEIKFSILNGSYYHYIYENVNASVTHITLKKLKHFSLYRVTIKACRETQKILDNLAIDLNCSSEAIINIKTRPVDDADDIRNFTVIREPTNQTSIIISWTKPLDPNGMIVSYTIKFQRIDSEHSKVEYKCISHEMFEMIKGIYHLNNLDAGNYSIQVMASSLNGDGNYTPAKHVYINKKNEGGLAGYALAIIIIVCISILVGGFLVYYYYCRRLPAINNIKLIASVNPDYAGVAYNQDDWEVPRENIIQLHELGQGSFGMVYEGIIKALKMPDDETRCAIKTVNENATDKERCSFLKEADVMKQFDTTHVVRLLGVVSQGQPTLVVMELMANGDLKGYLRSHRPDYESGDNLNPPQPPTLRRILQMAIEIADGMAYLSAKKFVHRDLAARNCMVAEDLTVKIGDFGMTRDIYETDYYRKGTKGLLPVRWMSPESLKDGVFTSSSDVFSYGVVLWEMATLASQPYQGLSNDQVLRYVIDGGVMERPENCPDKLYDLMRRCWQHRPTSRPSFMDIITMLLDDTQSSFRSVSFFHSPAGHDFFQQNTVQVPMDDVTTPLRQGEEGNSSVDVNDEYNDLMDRNNSHLVPDNGPLPIIRSPHSPLRMGIGSGNFIDSVVISFNSENDVLNNRNENISDSPNLMSIEDFGRSNNDNKSKSNDKLQQQDYNIENDMKKRKINGLYNGLSLKNNKIPNTIDRGSNILLAEAASGTTPGNDQKDISYNHHGNFVVSLGNKDDYDINIVDEMDEEAIEDDDNNDDDEFDDDDDEVYGHGNDVDDEEDDYDNDNGGNTFKLKIYRKPNNTNAYTKMNENKKRKTKKSEDELRPPKNRNGFLIKK